MNGLDKFLHVKDKAEEKINSVFGGVAVVDAFRTVCSWFCFFWVNFFAAVMPPIALLHYLNGSYLEAGWELVFAVLAIFANKYMYR